MDKNNPINIPYPLYLALALLALLIISGMFYVMERGRHIGTVHGAMIESAEAIIGHTSQAHLWLEENIIQAKETDDAAILGHIEVAGQDNLFIKKKGRHTHIFNEHPELAALQDQSADVDKLLEEFRLLTRRRLASPRLSGVGTDIDQQYDKVFRDMVDDVETMKAILTLSRDLHLKYFRATQILLIVVVVSLLLLLSIMLVARNRYLRTIIKSRIAQRKSEERYRNLFEDAQDMIHLVDRDGRIVDANRAELETMGYSRDEYIGKALTEIIHPDCRATTKEAAERVFSGERCRYVTAMVTKRGVRVDIEAHVTPYVENGTVVSTRAIVRDITERKKKEDELRHRLALEKAIAAVSRYFSTSAEVDLNVILRLLGAGVEVNRAYIFRLSDGGKQMNKLYEWCSPGTAPQIDTLQELDTGLYQWWMERMESDKYIIIPNVADLPAHAAAEKELLQAQGIHSLIAAPLHTHDGDLFGVIGLDDTVKRRNWSSDDGRALRITGTMVISYMRRRRAEHEVRQHTFFLKETQRVAKLGTYSFDVTTGLWTGSEVLDNIFGTPENYTKDVQGWFNIIHPDDRDRMERYLTKLMARQEPFNQEYRIVRVNDNETRWVHGLGEQAFDGAGNHVRMIGTIQDITERKTLEATLIESERQLHTLSSHILTVQERERRRLAFELHDELGQSLALLGLQLNNISMKLGDDQLSLKKECEESLHYLDKVIENTRRLSRDLSPAILEDLGLSMAVTQLIEDLTNHYDAEISIDLADINNLFTEDRQISIYRIFQESLANIVKHSKATRVSIVIRKMADSVYFSIEDNGIGYEHSAPLESGGRSMGLFTLKERLRMVKASFEMDSQVGEGTKISFTVSTNKAGG